MGKVVYIGDNRHRKVLDDAIKDAIAVKVTVVDRDDVARVLRDRGFSGSDEEIDALVHRGLADAIRKDEDREGVYRVIGRVVDRAEGSGEIRYADEAREALRKLGCEMISCSFCSECADGVCSRYNSSVSPEEALDCWHYNDSNQLLLKVGGQYEKLPYRCTYIMKPGDAGEIMKALKKNAEMADMIQFFSDEAEKNGENVRLITRFTR